MDDDALPGGYAYHWAANGRSRLVVPMEVARAAEEALRERQARELDERREEAKRQKESLDAQALAEAAKSKGLAEISPVPAAGFHRILLRFAEYTGEKAVQALQTRTADIDVSRRFEAIRQRLLELGPDRRIARPPNWREALDGLEAALPNFAHPLALLRDTLSLAEVTAAPVRIPPMLLLGGPGIGKSYFSHKLAEVFGVPHGVLAFDQPTYGAGLRGLDKAWGNSESGLLFNLVCMGDVANPLILLDELDKSTQGSGRREMDPLAQLHGALEPQTSRCIQDISTDIVFDASLVTYVATANSLRGLEMPLLSRFDVFDIGPPGIDDAIQVARNVVESALTRLGLTDRLRFERRCAVVLSRLSPRLMQRATERLIAAALREQRDVVTGEHVWALMGMEPESPRLH